MKSRRLESDHRRGRSPATGPSDSVTSAGDGLRGWRGRYECSRHRTRRRRRVPGRHGGRPRKGHGCRRRAHGRRRGGAELCPRRSAGSGEGARRQGRRGCVLSASCRGVLVGPRGVVAGPRGVGAVAAPARAVHAVLVWSAVIVAVRAVVRQRRRCRQGARQQQCEGRHQGQAAVQLHSGIVLYRGVQHPRLGRAAGGSQGVQPRVGQPADDTRRRQSLRAQRDHRIDARRAPRRNEVRQ